MITINILEPRFKKITLFDVRNVCCTGQQEVDRLCPDQC